MHLLFATILLYSTLEQLALLVIRNAKVLNRTKQTLDVKIHFIRTKYLDPSISTIFLKRDYTGKFHSYKTHAHKGEAFRVFLAVTGNNHFPGTYC